MRDPKLLAQRLEENWLHIGEFFASRNWPDTALGRAASDLNADIPAILEALRGYVPQSGSEIVGHKTLTDGSHESLTRAEADALWARAEASKQSRTDVMPTEEDAVRVMWSAFQRLRELGWRETMYLSSEKVGTVRLIEPGSSGIHEGHYMGEWPTGGWWLHEAGDLWPSRPCLGKPLESRDISGESK